MPLEFTPQQIDHICYQIEEWYIKWQDKMWIIDKANQHRLGIAKEELKTMICGEEYTDNSEKLKSEVEILYEKIKILENVSMVLGIAHGSITAILESPDSEIRIKLNDLWHKLSNDIGSLFYLKPTISQE